MTRLRGMGTMLLAAVTMVVVLVGVVTLESVRPSQAAPAASIIVTSDLDIISAGDGDCTLREAIINANKESDLSSGDCTAGSGADTISFDLLPDTTITLAGLQLPIITGTLTIDGSTASNLTVSGADLSRIMEIGNGAAVTLTSMTLSHAGHPLPGIGSNVAILNSGNMLTVSNATIRQNQGGGISNSDGSTLIVQSCNILNNTNGSGITNGGTLTVSNSSIAGNVNSPMRPVTFPVSGGGINNWGITTVTNSILYGNSAENFYSAQGGGIANSGTLLVSGSVFDSNSVFGGSGSFGGGISNSGSAIVESNYFGNNSINTYGPISVAGKGGGIYNEGDMIIEYSTISSNAVLQDLFLYEYVNSGGGIANSGTLFVNSSTINFNSVTGNDFPGNMANGGGIANLSGVLTITNSTISGNTAESIGEGVANGGGIYIDSGTVTVSNSTIVSNTAVVSGTGTASGGGLNNAGTLQLSNSIIANSPYGGDCVNGGKVSLNIGNLVEDGSCSPAFSGDPLLGPLQGNGGVTLTHAPLEGSIAIDNGDNAICESSDQRFIPRPIDGNDDGTAVCDIGSVEIGGAFTFLPVVMKTSE